MFRHLKTIWWMVLAGLIAGAAMADSTSVYKLGVTVRTRIETTDNATYLETAQQQGSSYLRNRTGVMFQLFPAKHLEFGVRMTNEFRYYFVPESKRYGFDEVVFDQLYVAADSIGGKPVKAIIGRQNISLGEGFLLQDGGPLDGSRTAYFNAVNVAWQISQKLQLSLIAVGQFKDDDPLPVIHDQKKALSEQNEQAAIAYLTAKLGQTNLQTYLMLKNNDGSKTFPEADITCGGARIQVPLSKKVTLTSEVAGQLGSWGEVDHQAIGGYAYAEYKTGWPIHFPKSFILGGLYLSGDDASTADHEGWEPMFGRFPKWSESYAYTLTREAAIAYWSNMSSVFVKTAVDLAPSLTFATEYHRLMAPQALPAGAGVTQGSHKFPGGTGTTRGDLIIAKLTYQMKPNLSGHWWIERFYPGDFYFSGADASGWMRMEVMLTF